MIFRNKPCKTCGHSPSAHEHFTDQTHCSDCACKAYRRTTFGSPGTPVPTESQRSEAEQLEAMVAAVWDSISAARLQRAARAIFWVDVPGCLKPQIVEQVALNFLQPLDELQIPVLEHREMGH